MMHSSPLTLPEINITLTNQDAVSAITSIALLNQFIHCSIFREVEVFRASFDPDRVEKFHRWLRGLHMSSDSQ
jgi:hypothetical protein